MVATSVSTLPFGAPTSCARSSSSGRTSTTRARSLWRTGPTLTAADLAAIDRPVLVLVGDDDAVFLRHTIALYEALPQGQLAIVPGTSHLVPIEKPDLVNRLVVDFLDDGAVMSMLPMRRAGVVS